MNWIKKLISASVLTSLLLVVPEKAQAEMCGSCGLFNTGGYNLYAFAQNVNTLASCAAPVSISAVPVYLSNPTAFLNSFATPSFAAYPSPSYGGICASFTQSCGSCYDNLGLGGYGTSPLMPSVDNQLIQLISYQNNLLNQLSNPYLGGLISNPPLTIQPYPYPSPITFNPYGPGGGIPSFPPSSPFDNSVPFPTTPSLPYGGCDNVTVMCPQSGWNSFDNVFPGGSPGATPSAPELSPELGVGSLPPNQNLIPRGFKAHR